MYCGTAYRVVRLSALQLGRMAYCCSSDHIFIPLVDYLLVHSFGPLIGGSPDA